ncbi:unnamed protein product, partial [Mesorhabditis belari]|uniref:Uncharacterized protein n=1 Tax=Mesorhabditis belari TaxID=2138241 RepID=A0AAF3E9V0_9BILA
MHPLRCVLILTVVLLERNVVITSDEDSDEQVDNCPKGHCMHVSLVELLESTWEILKSDLCEGICLCEVCHSEDSLEKDPCECKLNGSALETRTGHLFVDFAQKIFTFYNKTSSDSDVIPECAESFKKGTIMGKIIWFGWQIGRCTRTGCQYMYWRLMFGGPKECSCEIGGDEEKELAFAHYIYQTGQSEKYKLPGGTCLVGESLDCDATKLVNFEKIMAKIITTVQGFNKLVNHDGNCICQRDPPGLCTCCLSFTPIQPWDILQFVLTMISTWKTASDDTLRKALSQQEIHTKGFYSEGIQMCTWDRETPNCTFGNRITNTLT